VAGAYTHDRSSPLRWIASHLWRYRHYLFGFLVMSLLVSVLFSALPRLTGRAFDAALQEGEGRRLLVRGALDLAHPFTVET
jgi:ATP-binding cassette subfamily B protein